MKFSLYSILPLCFLSALSFSPDIEAAQLTIGDFIRLRVATLNSEVQAKVAAQAMSALEKVSVSGAAYQSHLIEVIGSRSSATGENYSLIISTTTKPSHLLVVDENFEVLGHPDPKWRAWRRRGRPELAFLIPTLLEARRTAEINQSHTMELTMPSMTMLAIDSLLTHIDASYIPKLSTAAQLCGGLF